MLRRQRDQSLRQKLPRLRCGPLVIVQAILFCLTGACRIILSAQLRMSGAGCSAFSDVNKAERRCFAYRQMQILETMQAAILVTPLSVMTLRPEFCKAKV